MYKFDEENEINNIENWGYIRINEHFILAKTKIGEYEEKDPFYFVVGFQGHPLYEPNEYQILGYSLYLAEALYMALQTCADKLQRSMSYEEMKTLEFKQFLDCVNNEKPCTNFDSQLPDIDEITGYESSVSLLIQEDGKVYLYEH